MANNRPKEQMRLTIEFADNGIILRNPDLEDEVTLAMHPDCGKNLHCTAPVEEYKAIGKKVYTWLTEVAITEHSDTWISTGAELTITATLTGRKM